MAQALQHDQAVLIAELSTTGSADIDLGNCGSERGNAEVSIPLVQNIRQVASVSAFRATLSSESKAWLRAINNFKSPEDQTQDISFVKKT